MGWWKVEGTGSLIGDGPLDILGGAISEIVGEYVRDHGRRPTPAEWEQLLLAVLGAEEPEYRVLDDANDLVVGVELQVTNES